MKKIRALLLTSVVLIYMFYGVHKIHRVGASSTIYIRTNGIISPSSAPISTLDNITYFLVGDVNDELVVERSNVIIDGSGYTLQGSLEGTGVNVANVNNVTIRHITIRDFLNGIVVNFGGNHNITGNTVISNSLSGVRIISSTQNVISGNVIENNTFYGAYFSSSTHNSILRNNITNGDDYGIWLTSSSHNTISENKVENNNLNGVWLRESNSNTISRNHIANNGDGIYLSSSSNSNDIFHNSIDTNNYGLRVRDSINNKVVNNSISDNSIYGVYFQESPDMMLRNNSLTMNYYNFAAVGFNLTDFSLDIDESNTLNSKPIVYWVNRQNESVPSNAGYVALINSTRIEVVGLELHNNFQGILLYQTTDSQIMYSNITYNSVGIQLHQSENNTLFGNNIQFNNDYGIALVSSSNNIIRHNNFIENDEQIYLSASDGNIWNFDYPSGGNYWSDSQSKDYYRGLLQNKTGSDGIGDNFYSIDTNNQDSYPFMGPINFFDAGTWNSTTYFIEIVSNSTLSGFYFNPSDSVKHFRYNASGFDGTSGFCRVTFSMEFLEGPYEVLLNDTPVQITSGTTNGTHTFLYFAYNHSAKTLKVIGTDAIPEPLQMAILLLLSLIILCSARLIRKKQPLVKA